MIIRVLSSLALAAILSLPLHAAETEDAKLQAIVNRAADQYEKLFAARDAKGLAALFAEEAEYVEDDGTVFHGRTAIEAEFTAAFETLPPSKVSTSITAIRPISPGVLVEEGISTFIPEKDGPVSHTHYTATHVKQSDGTWLLASVRELHPSRMAAHEQLKSLAWLIGQWREEVDGSSISTTWKWSPDGSYLLSDFTVRAAGGTNWQGTHRIGWDADQKQFRSWIFESTGGFGEGVWVEEDNGWSVNLSTLSALGIRSTSTLSYEPDGADAIAVSLTRRIRAGVNQPDSRHRIVRQPPSPSANPTETKTKP